jgi:D-alanyl-D-alanine carboxypeptidase
MSHSRWIPAVIAMMAIAAAGASGGATVERQSPGQGPDPHVRAHVDAFVAALTSGSAERFEAMAREHFAPDAYARRTPDDRRQLVERLRADFGTLSVSRVEASATGKVTLQVRGSTTLDARVELTLETAAPYRITSVAIAVGGPGDEKGPGDAPPAPVVPSMTPAQLSAALDGYLTPMAASDAFAGVVLVARDGAAVYERPFGLADRATKAAITPATRFNLGSINKIFTKTAIAQLVAQGRLAITDTIGKLLSDYPNAQAKAATIDQLLNHRAGISDFFVPEFDREPKSRFRSNADYYKFVAPRPLLFEPGTKTEYCNGCYVVLGAIIERVSGIRYEDYIAEHVFKPAGMKRAGFFQSDHFPSDVAIGYTRQGPGTPGTLRTNETMHGAAGSAAGGAYATAADLLAFDSALRDGRLLDAKMTAWVLGGGGGTGRRAAAPLGIAGGAPGCNADLESDGTWTVVVVGNLDPPNAVRVGKAIRQPLSR